MPLALMSVLAFLGVTGSAVAKGNSYLVGARFFPGAPGQPIVEVPIALPENYDDMYEAEPPEGEFGSLAQSTGYRIELRYDFSADGYGTRTRLGWYDGKDRIFFSEPMSVGPGTWEAGWFTASPLLAATLQRGLAPTPPAAGNSSAGRAARGPVSMGVTLSGAVTVLAMASAWCAAMVSRRRAA